MGVELSQPGSGEATPVVAGDVMPSSQPVSPGDHLSVFIFDASAYRGEFPVELPKVIVPVHQSSEVPSGRLGVTDALVERVLNSEGSDDTSATRVIKEVLGRVVTGMELDESFDLVVGGAVRPAEEGSGEVPYVGLGVHVVASSETTQGTPPDSVQVPEEFRPACVYVFGLSDRVRQLEKYDEVLRGHVRNDPYRLEFELF